MIDNSEPTTIGTPRGRPFDRESHWGVIALVGAGVAIGVLLGAGVALLTAPRAGGHTRLALARELRRRRPWKKSPWHRLGDELAQVAARRNKRFMRAAAG